MAFPPICKQSRSLRQLLLDEKRPQIAQLPRARHAQHGQLNQHPPHHPPVHTLALIPKLRLPLPLKDLLSPDVLQARVDVPHFGHHLAHLPFIAALDGRGLADGHVELEFDAAHAAAGEEEPGGRGDVGRGEAEAVVARVRGREGEFACAGAALRDDAVVVVEGFVDGDVDAL